MYYHQEFTQPYVDRYIYLFNKHSPPRYKFSLSGIFLTRLLLRKPTGLLEVSMRCEQTSSDTGSSHSSRDR